MHEDVYDDSAMYAGPVEGDTMTAESASSLGWVDHVNSAVKGLFCVALAAFFVTGPFLALALRVAGSQAQGRVLKVERLDATDMTYALEGRRRSRPNAVATVRFVDRRGVSRVGRLPVRMRGCRGDVCPVKAEQWISVRYVPFFWSDRLVLDRSEGRSFADGGWKQLAIFGFAVTVALTLHACGIRGNNTYRMFRDSFGGGRR